MANSYYDHTSYPGTGTFGTSADLRAELDAIEAGFDKLIDPAVHAGQVVLINAGGTAMTGDAGLKFSNGVLTLNGVLSGAGLTIESPTINNAALDAVALTDPTITGGSISALAAPLPVDSGGTGATSASSALIALGGLPLAGGTMTGALVVQAGGLTISAGGLTISAGGLTISANGASIAGGLAVASGALSIGGQELAGAVYNAFASWSPDIADGATGFKVISVPGANRGDFAEWATAETLTGYLLQVTVAITDADTGTIFVTNRTGSVFNPGAANWYIRAKKRTA